MRRRDKVAYKWWLKLMWDNCGGTWRRQYNAELSKGELTEPGILAAHICSRQPELDVQTVFEMCEAIYEAEK